MTNTIASERKRLGLSQSGLGEMLGKNRSTIARWEADPSSVTVRYLEMMVEIFGCSLDYLLGRVEERVPIQKENQVGREWPQRETVV